MGKAAFFNKANMTVNDWWVVVGDKAYSILTILSAEMATTVIPLDWRNFAREHLRTFATVVVISAGLALLHWEGWLILPSFWLIQFLQDIGTFRKKGTEDTLVLNTRNGPMPIASLDDSTYIHLIAREINSRISENSGATLIQQGGVPTRQIVAD